MPARLVDGDALWRSKKLKEVPVALRAEYANLLPLAEANGGFEYDPDRVWADVFAFNRPDVTPERCAAILEAYIAAGMLEVYEQNGKQYGFWVGIDKPGRLPSPAHQARYATLPPVPTSVERKAALAELSAHDQAIGIASSTGNRPIDSEVESRIRTALNQCEEKTLWKRELRIAVQAHGYDVLLEALDLWLESQSTFTGRRPVTAFLRALPSLAGASRGPATVKSAALQQVEDAIALASNNHVVFSNQEKPHLALLVKEHGPDAVIQVFRDFYGKLDDFGIKWATKNFLEKAPQFLRTLRIQREERERQDAFAATQAAAMQQQAQTEAATLAQQEAEAEDVADEAFAEFEEN
jgi:hypothetical protein